MTKIPLNSWGGIDKYTKFVFPIGKVDARTMFTLGREKAPTRLDCESYIL